MPISPATIVFPASRIRRIIRIIHDGTVNAPFEFSLAELEFHDNSTAIGIRNNMNDWNENNPDLGYPTCRPGNPTWFMLPDIQLLLPVLNQAFGNTINP